MSTMRVKELYHDIVDKLTLSQFSKIMGGDMSYQAKVTKVRKVTRNKDVLALCDELETLLKESEVFSEA